ncbi:hypothetical protein MLD38_031975 [Melastoma candidum]|uniref:Uncharacterized protein n=1 Tax=Melastoma candidum TaxID=119954 RepID=A0ACB9MSF2_9MYRT|nr:hypothetical protein MLD38_031975 [Melastoma candidum]
MSSYSGGGDPSLQWRARRRVLRMQAEGNFGGQSSFDSEVVPSSLAEIAPILRVANEVESSNPRVAYLCRFYAFDKALRLDPTSSGRGVRQFKTAFLRQLEMENEPTLMGRRKMNDAREMVAFYSEYYHKYINELENAADKDERAQLRKAYHTASVLFEVLKAVDVEGTQVDSEILEGHKKVVEKTRVYVPYNILPLDPDSVNQAIMMYPEIQAVLFSLRFTEGLPWPKDHGKKDVDIIDWLQYVFGFQKDNAANQREHLILLLVNVHMCRFPKPDETLKLDDRALDHIMEKLFHNYKKWCKFLDCKSSLLLPTVQVEVQQRKLMYVGLYLLIWGEAANLRFMPECLCYIYHHMALELHGMLAGSVNGSGGNIVKPAYGDEEEDFLRKVVTPIYNVIAKEAQNSKNGTSKHSEWRNYDDLNEYFWSIDCFNLGWPMRADANFFHLREKWPSLEKKEDQWIGKSNFVEIRSFWQIFRSFDRMWNFFILSLQVMIIVAWNDDGNAAALFTPNVFRKVLSVFITAPTLKLGQALLDVVLNWKAQRSMSKFSKLRYILKIISAGSWLGILLTTYAHKWDNAPGFVQTILSWFGTEEYSPPLFIIAILIYSLPNMLDALLFLFPSIRCFLEQSNFKILKLLMWWFQPHLYVGRGMHENLFSLFKYSLFWVLLLMTKLVFSFMVEIRPLVDLTKKFESFRVYNNMSDLLSPELVENSFGVLIAVWSPVILVYFMDTQIWYAIFSSLFGVIYGAFHRQGEIQSLEGVRSHFKSFPGVFSVCLIPEDINELERKGLESTSPPQDHQVLSNKEKETARFAQLWNQIISSLREEDLINNREMDLLLVPYWADCEMDVMQWPLMLLSNKMTEALDMAKGGYSKDEELKRRLNNDYYMSCAIRECYAQFRSIIRVLVQGECEKEIVEFIFNEVDGYIEAGELVSKFKMSALDTLYEHFLRLINYLLENKQEDADSVVILFQDMLEVIRRDMMEDDCLSSILEPTDGSAPLEQDYRMYFASEGAIRFPIQPVTEAWQEKIKRLYLLLATKESTMDVPSNLEARRRISFFSNSLFMEMPPAPEVHKVLPFSILTTHFKERISFSSEDLDIQNEDGVSTIFYLQKIFSDEWNNFLERVNCRSEEECRSSDELEEKLRLWASCRSQTLTRTVRGMMYHRKALELQAFLDMAKDEELIEGYKAVALGAKDPSRGDKPLWAQCQAAADMKFTFVVSCQQYGNDKRAGHPRAQDMLRLMTTYPSMRVAYIDEVEDVNRERDGSISQKVYYSTLVKASPNSMDKWPDQIIYRIKLPGNPTLGEGKAENQNHAIIFTRGEALQTIDFNQDNYMEEALKMRNLLQEFLNENDDERHPTILGHREHIFTGSVSSLAWFVANLETSFSTIGQRVLANPLKVRFHYGHPDVFDRLFHLTRGGISKASKVINLSRDIFAGFDSTLREGNVTHHEYIQVGKGRSVGFNEISSFDSHVAKGNGEQTLSRDVYRLGQRFDFFRMLSFYFTTVGFYFNALITELTVYVFLYGLLYIILCGLPYEFGPMAIQNNVSLQVALASQSFVQIGFLTALPMLMEIALERASKCH